MESFPEDVRQFLQHSIASVEHLEILRILGEDQTREWIDYEIGKQAQIAAETIRDHLQYLEQRGLLRCRTNETGVVCQFGPHSTDLADKVTRLLELYRQRPVTMIRLVYERPSASLRDFADAFRIKNKET